MREFRFDPVAMAAGKGAEIAHQVHGAMG